MDDACGPMPYQLIIIESLFVIIKQINADMHGSNECNNDEIVVKYSGGKNKKQVTHYGQIWW